MAVGTIILLVLGGGCLLFLILIGVAAWVMAKIDAAIQEVSEDLG